MRRKRQIPKYTSAKIIKAIMPGMPIRRTMSWNENVVSASPIMGVEWGRGRGLPRCSVEGGVAPYSI